MTKRTFRFPLTTCFWIVMFAAVAVGIGLQQRRIDRLQQEFDRLQAEHETLKDVLVDQPPVREIPLALR